jgi:hypothetical protein
MQHLSPPQQKSNSRGKEGNQGCHCCPGNCPPPKNESKDPLMFGITWNYTLIKEYLSELTVKKNNYRDQ